VHPYGGAFSDGLNWPHDCNEIYNDIDGRLTNFWRVLQDPETFDQFKRRVEATPFSQVEWQRSKEGGESAVDRAAAFFVLNRQSMAGMMRSFAPLTTKRLRRGMSEQASAWWSAVDGLADVYHRMRRVVILNKDGEACIKSLDGPSVAFVIDPPYPADTRTASDIYTYEMSDTQHHSLLKTLQNIQGKAVVSSYPNRMYDEMLKDWKREVVLIDNKASKAEVKPKKQEVLYSNF